MFDIMS